jgi:hypothetical protein
LYVEACDFFVVWGGGFDGGCAGLKLGESVVAPKDTPLCNAWLTLLNGIGVEAERHGDSTGLLKEVMA